MSKTMKILVLLLATSSLSNAGSASVTLDMDATKALSLVKDALVWWAGSDSFMPYNGGKNFIEYKSAPVEMDYEVYKDYILPAYLYSTKAPARVVYIVTVHKIDDKTELKVEAGWQIQTGQDWVEVQSNNEHEKKFVNFLEKYCNDPASFKK